jgi:Zn-dependent peptidase ImmA (M78 family)
VRRATVAHELGHLLFDPVQRLDRVRVDTYQSNEIDPESQLDLASAATDVVEQRANAFSIALLAPMQAVRDMTPSPLRSGAIERVMSEFGISYTAARHHICNAHYRQFEDSRNSGLAVIHRTNFTGP